MLSLGYFLVEEIGYMYFVLPFVVSLVVWVRMHNFTIFQNLTKATLHFPNGKLSDI